MRSRIGSLPRDRSRSIAAGAAAGRGLVEQRVDDGELLEHVGAVLGELLARGVDHDRNGGASTPATHRTVR